MQFIKFIPYDLAACPYIALVCIGTHNHPPPPPERTPVGIRDELQTMIQNIITSDDSVTPRSIIASRFLLKKIITQFNTKILIILYYILFK